MKPFASRVSLLLLTCLGIHSWADEVVFYPDFLQSPFISIDHDMPAPIASPWDLFKEFENRLKTALKTGDPQTLKALYWRGVAGTLDVASDVQRLQQVPKEKTETKISLWWKVLSKLPPKAREVWVNHARCVTEYEATHLALIISGSCSRLTLPLIISDARLLILPSGSAVFARPNP